MSEYTDQRDAIKTIVEGITDIGTVHTRPRYGDFYDHYVIDIDGKRQIRAWEIGIDEPGVETARQSQTHIHRRRWWAIRGYIGLEDDAATYDTINDLALLIQQALDADLTLTGTALDHDPVQVDEPIPITLGGDALCWGTTLRFFAYTID